MILKEWIGRVASEILAGIYFDSVNATFTLKYIACAQYEYVEFVLNNPLCKYNKWIKCCYSVKTSAPFSDVGAQ